MMKLLYISIQLLVMVEWLMQQNAMLIQELSLLNQHPIAIGNM